MNEKRISIVIMSGLRALMCAVLVAVGLAACTTHDDNPVINPQDVAKEIVGQWIMINDIPADADFNLEDFEIDDDFPVALLDDHKEVAYLRFNESGEGMFIYFNVDKTNVPIGSEDDEDMQMSVLFDYTVQPDGTIKVFNMTDVEGTEDNEDPTFRYDNALSKAENREKAREFLKQVKRGDYFQMAANYYYGVGAHSMMFIEDYDPETDSVHWADSNMKGKSVNGERYAYVQYDAVKEIDWFVDAFCRSKYGATIYRLRDDIIYAQ